MSCPVSLYLHIPFCHVRCKFCNLHAYGMGDYSQQPDLRAAYTDALRREVTVWASRLADDEAAVSVPTVFFGGGTPTELTADQLAGILDAIRHHFPLQPDAEITVEGYPGLDRVYLATLQQAGVNRLSLGVQSFDPALLALLDRAHTPFEVAVTVEAARAVGIRSVALDLIYGLPGQTRDQWAATLEQALALRPDGLSLYALSLDEATRLRALVQRGTLPAPDAETMAGMYAWARARLVEVGLAQVEISNWARPGHACRHNQVYWRNQPWLGLGAGATGFYAGRRWTNIPAPQRYIEAVRAGRLPIAAEERLDPATEMAETVMLGLRLREGVDLAQFARRFGRRFEDVYAAPLADLGPSGALVVEGGRARLAEDALFVSNEVLQRFLA